MNYLKTVNPLSKLEVGNYLEDKISIDVSTFSTDCYLYESKLVALSLCIFSLVSIAQQNGKL